MKPKVLQRAIEIFQIEWFTEITVAAVFKRCFLHAVNVVGSNGNDRDVISFSLEIAKVFDRLQAIQNGHVQIDNNQTRSISPGYLQSLLAVFSFENVISFQFKRPLEHNASVV